MNRFALRGMVALVWLCVSAAQSHAVEPAETIPRLPPPPPIESRPDAGGPPAGQPPAPPVEPTNEPPKEASKPKPKTNQASALTAGAAAAGADTALALASLPTSTTDIFTGTLSAALPILVPSGRLGVQPALSLAYWTGNGNGWVGMGWKLEVGAIERQTRFGVDYGADDYTFRLSGVATDLVSIGSGEYRAKIEGGFSRVRKLTAADGKPYWEATDKKGTRYLFGQTAASRQADPADGSKIFKWDLDQVIDPNGNYMTATYTADQGQDYLDRIDYTGNGSTQPTNTVKFYLETRPDAPAVYATNFQVVTAKRLKTIDVLANGNRVRAYKLNYTASGSTTRSLLSSVQQYGKDATLDGTGTITGGTSLPPQTFTFQAGGGQWTSSSTAFTWWDSNFYNGWQAKGDFNGDGKTDFIGWNGSYTTARLYLSTGSGFSESSIPFTWYTSNMSDSWIRQGDFNGDGKTDFIGWNGSTSTARLYLATGTGFTESSIAFTWYTANLTDSWIRQGDFNGDGKTDFIGWNGSTSTARLYLATGTGFTESSIPFTWYTTNLTNSWLTQGDFNGDGKTDFLGWNGSYTTARLYLATGSGFTESSVPFTWWSADFYNGWQTQGDFNGDGKTDFIRWNGSYTTATLVLATGSGFTESVVPFTWYDSNFYNGWQTQGDFNGDGKTDFIGWNGSYSTARLYLATGAGFTESSVPFTWWSADFYNGWQTQGDFNGDGKTDFICWEGSYSTAKLQLASPTTAPDLLASLSNGLGGTTTIAYTPSTQYANTQLPFPIQTVSSITTNDGNGNVSTTTYTFSGGFYHIGERDLRGFNYAKATGPVGPNGEQAITETWFHQGNDTAVDVNNPNVPDGYMKGKPYKVRVSDGAAHLYSETRTTYAGGPTSAPFFNPPAQVITDICDGGACGQQTRTDYTHDGYGNVIREDQYGEVGVTTDDRTVVRTFSANTTVWIVGLPLSETLYQGIGTSSQVAQTTFYYDGVTDCASASTNQNPTQGNLTRVVRWLTGGTNPETRMAYDSYGNLLCTRDANGNTSTITYDGSFTFPTVVTNPLSQQKTTQYYGVDGVAMDTGLYGQVKSVIDPNNAVIATTYDVFGRKSQVTFPDGGWTSTAYNNFGTVGSQNIQTNTQAGLSSWTYFDGLGRTMLAKSTGPDSKVIATQTQYNVRGAVLQSSLPYFDGTESPTGRWTTFVYDPVGRVTQATNPDSSRVLSCTSNWVTVTVDANNHRRREARDAYGRLVRIDEYAGTVTTCETSAGSPYATTTYQYDVLGNLLTVTDAKGNQSTMTYDTLSRKTAMHDPDMGNWAYTYDAAGNLTQQTDAKSQNIYFRYDALNRRVQKDYGTQKPPGSGDVIYTYDGATSNGKGRLTSVQDPSGTVIFYYDTLGRTTRSDKLLDGTTYTTQTSYDTLGRVLTITYPDNAAVSYAYNGPLLLKAYEGTTTYGQYGSYNSLGQPGTLTFGNGVVTAYTYSNTGNTTCPAQNFRPCTIKTVLWANPAYQDLTYGYDTGGNITAITDAVNGNQTFGYDEMNRLTSAAATTGPAQYSHTYTYNEIGNLLSNTLLGTYTYPASGSGSVQPHAVTTAGSNTYGYDNNGNMTSGAGRTLTYDYENRPTSITSGGVTTTLVYDGDGGRVKKSDGTTTVRYIGKLYECATTGGSSTCQKYIFAGSQRLAVKQVSGGAVDYYHVDHLNSSSVVTHGTTGAVEETLAYYPFGATRVDTHNSADVPFKYTGQELDSSTGLYFYGARYYDVTLGRFISADTIVLSAADPQSLNRYSYAGNNPIIRNDPTGQFWEIVAIAAIIGGTVAGVQSHGDPFAIFVGATAGAVGGGTGAWAFGAAGGGLLGSFVGGAVGGGAAALTGDALYTAAGYNVDWGRTLGAGIVGGGVGGLVGGYIGLPPAQGGLGFGLEAGLIAGAAAGGATAAAIAGGDPGLGAAYGAAGAFLYLAYYQMFPQEAGGPRGRDLNYVEANERFVNPTGGELRGCDLRGCGGYGDPRGMYRHPGIDITSIPEQHVVGPFGGTAMVDPGGGVRIESGSKVGRLLYVKPGFEGQISIQAGSPIGTALNITPTYPGITNHVHFELYLGGKNVDPTPFVFPGK